jgi:hypothetical protein
MKFGEPDYAFNDDEVNMIVGSMWRFVHPGLLLLNAWSHIVSRGGTEHRVETALTRLTPNSEREALARDREYDAWLRPRLERHCGFKALQRYFAAIGIEGRYLGFGEYSGQMSTYGFLIREEHLAALEAMAQDEAGFTTPEAKAAAARDFRLFMRRHYDADWESNQASLPVIDASPYGPPPLAAGNAAVLPPRQG